MNSIYISAEIISTLLETSCGFFFISIFFRNGSYSRKTTVMLLHSIILSSLILLCNSLHLFSLLALFLAPLYFSISAAFLFHVNPFFSFSLSGFYCLLIHSIDIFYISSVGTLFSIPDLAEKITKGFSPIRLIFLVISKCTLLLLCFLFYKLSFHFSYSLYRSAAIFPLTLFSYTGIFYLIYMTFCSAGINTLFYWILFALTQSALLAFLLIYHKYREEQDKQILFQLHNTHLEENYNRIKELYQADAHIRHDLKNNLLCIRHKLNNHQTAEALSALDELLTPLSSFDSTVITGDSSIDFVLNYKNQEAIQKQIAMQIDAQFYSGSHLESEDICTILFNLLDNAIEECCRLPDNIPRKISVSMRHIRGFYFIKIENSCHTSPFDANHRLSTSKYDHLHHGLGLDIVRTTAEKYQGVVNLTYDNHLFTATLSLF
ncbi:MAG: GHKL domain-containing protein [Clostridiales bacterium]|nr:GHKL domain-containing protein [Clostridiales bacterium]